MLHIVGVRGCGKLPTCPESQASREAKKVKKVALRRALDQQACLPSLCVSLSSA